MNCLWGFYKTGIEKALNEGAKKSTVGKIKCKTN